MNPERFHGCKAILFDFGGTLDSDGEHWLDRFYALYGDVGLRIPLSEIKRAFYHADGLCSSDSQGVSLGLRRLMKRHVRFRFAALDLADDEKEMEMVEAFCTKSERFLRRNARLLRRMRDRFRLGLVSNFYGNVAAFERFQLPPEEVICVGDSFEPGNPRESPTFRNLSGRNEVKLPALEGGASR